MDKFETDSNYSYYSDSLVSNASSLSGLSFYEDEFAEVKHLINPNKYPSTQLGRCSTPKVHNECFDNEEKIINLQNELQKSLQLNIKYKNELINLEKRYEVKFHDKIEQLQRNNTNLEGQLDNANNQIERLIRSYKDKNAYALFEEKLQLERRIKELSFRSNKLESECAIFKQEKDNLLLENKNLKICLGEYTTDLDVKKTSIQKLKEKISEQHVEIENYLKENKTLLGKINFQSAKVENYEKSSNWFKEQLHLLQKHKQTHNEEILKYKNKISGLKENISGLNIDLCKCKSQIDHMRLQALKEKESLYTKLEKINVNFHLPHKVEISSSNEPDSRASYESSLDDMKHELSILKRNIQEKDDEYEALKKESSEILSKCLVLQKSLQHAESTVELLENHKKEMFKNLGFFNENLKEKLCENVELKNRISGLEIELKTQNQEKKSTESAIDVIRGQFFSFKKNYEKVKDELNLKHKEVLQLENDRQQLFMQHNWTKCELEKTKHKDIVIENLNKDIISLQDKITEQNNIITDLKFQILKKEKILGEKDCAISEKQKDLDNYDLVLLQYKSIHSDYDNKVNYLQNNLKIIEEEKSKLEEDYNNLKVELKQKDIKMEKIFKRKEQLKSEQKSFIFEKQQLLELTNMREEEHKTKLRQKEKDIHDLQNKLKNLEADYGQYLKRNTDDHKVEIKMLLNDEKFLNSVFDQLNFDEFENSVTIRLKHLEEKLSKGHRECQDLKSKLSEKDDQVKELEVLLQVKTRELQTKKISMDKNNRTLLRKLKEHMRGRNSAEKQLKYLHDLYDSLSDSHNTLMLSQTEKDCSIHTLQELCVKYEEKIKCSGEDIVRLEQQINKVEKCQLCFDAEQIRENYAVLEKIYNELQESNTKLENECDEYKKTIQKFSNEIKEKCFENLKLNSIIEEYKNSVDVLNQKEINYRCQGDIIHNLTQNLEDKEEVCYKNEMTIKSLALELEQANEKIIYFSDEIQQLSSNLQQKLEDIAQSEESKASIEDRFMQETVRNENLMTDMKNNLLCFENEIANLKNDKFFLQRLTNDLQIALKSYAEQNKVLKEQLLLFSKENKKTSNLSMFVFNDLPTSVKYDETYINKLLSENKSNQKPVTSEMENCLKKLKEEITSLQSEITRKNQA